MKQRKWLIIVGIIILLVVVIIGYRLIKPEHVRTQKLSISPPAALLVKVAPVKQTALVESYQTVGTLQANQNVAVSAEINGHVKQILFEQGKFVKAGMPLVLLDSENYQAKLLSAKAAYVLNKSNFERNKPLVEKGLLAKAAFDKINSDYQQAQADLQSAQSDLDKTTISAPFSGVLGVRQINLGEYVTAGQALVNLTDIQNLKVTYQVPENYLGRVKIGQKVEIVPNATSKKEYQGSVNFVSPTVDSNTRTLEVQANIPNQNSELAPGQFVTVTEYLEINPNSLIVPRRAIFATAKGSAVYRIVNGKAKLTLVKTGQETQDNIQIVSGLSANDSVVTDGMQDLSDGAVVTVQNK